MEWLEIDRDNLPKGEVLAANFLPKSYGYQEKIIGVLYENQFNSKISCESDSEFMDNATHYIDLEKFDL